MHDCSYITWLYGAMGPTSQSVSSRDKGLPSVTTVRITEHNGASAAVLPAQGKQQEVVVVDSALIKPSRLMSLFSIDFKLLQFI